jgi:class 3 adenylate cyclase
MSEDTRKLVCCRNISIIARFVEKAIGSDALLLENLPSSTEYLRNENNWITLAEYNQIMARAIDLVKDDRAPYKMGLSAQELESWGAFRYLQKVFASVILGPVEIYKQVGKYNEFFNKTKDQIVVKTAKDHCYIKVKFKNQVNAVDDFYSDGFIRGILCSVPRIWNLPEAEVEMPLCEYDLRRLLDQIGQIDMERVRFAGDKVYLDDELIAEQVILLPESDNHDLFLGKYRKPGQGDDWEFVRWGFLILKDLEINSNLRLHKGSIYNAPYFIYKISWQPLGFFKKVFQFGTKSHISKQAYREGLESQLSTIKNYVETLEDKVIRRTEELNKAKEESDYWRGQAENLLQTMLPQNIVEEMMQGRLEAKEMHGTIVFTDLADFTAFSKDLAPEQISRELTRYFTEMSHIITEHHGWVNKFLGDGILALFGLQGREDHTELALKASIAMQKAMERYPWQKRIGIATGEFITGEFGTEDTRRFDCLGHTVNYASRLQSHATNGEVLVCQTTYDKIAHQFNFKEPKIISPKGVGEVKVFPLIYS